MDYRFMGQQVQKFRREKGLTQEQLAEAVHLSPSFIGHIERGTRKASLESIVAIGSYLNISLDTLIMPQLDKTHDDFTKKQLFKACDLLRLAVHMCGEK